MKRQKIKAPANPISNSKIGDCKKICINPPTIKIISPANKLKCIYYILLPDNG